MARQYEELTGALGRKIYFRPERSKVRDLLSSDARPALRLGEVDLPIVDMSMNGLSVQAPPDVAQALPQTEVELAVLLHDEVRFEGRGRIARVRPQGRQALVGVAVTQGFLDLAALAYQDGEAQLERELQTGTDPLAEQVPAAYREALSRVVTFVQYHRTVLDRHEARYKALGGAEGRAGIEALQHKALRALQGPWEELRLAACRAAEAHADDRRARAAAKRLTEAVLTPLLLDAPCVRRSYEKPLGYPGDYRVMLQCYNDDFEGPNVFGRVFHKLWLAHPLPSGVRTRRDFVVELALEQQARLLARSPAAELRVTSLGCGPAREVPSFTAQRPDWQGSILWTLVDQDDDALSYAYRTAHPALAEADGDSRLRCLNVSFAQLIQDPALLALGGPQHLIASSGLFDYLPARAAQVLLAAMYARLAPGGLVAIGNATGPNEDWWSPEYVLDWSLRYRTRADMEGLAAMLPEDAETTVTLEPGEAYWYLLARKPGTPE